MRSIIPVIRLVIIVSFIFCGVTIHGCDCSKEVLDEYKCRSCTATYTSTHMEAAFETVCGKRDEREEKERAFFEKWNDPLIEVKCKDE